MVSVGDGQDGVGAWGRGEPRAWPYSAISTWSFSILVPLVTPALRNTWWGMEKVQEVLGIREMLWPTSHRKWLRCDCRA